MNDTLFNAAAHDVVEHIEEYVAENGQLSPDNPEHVHAFIATANYGNMDSANVMIKHGMHPNVANANGITPLMAAARKGHSDIVKFLLDKDADKTMKDNLGKTALDYAKEGGHSEIVRILEEYGAE